MRVLRQVTLVKYESLSRPPRFAVGDIIRCSAFEFGFQFAGNKQIAVAWFNQHHPQYHAQNGRGVIKNDPSRGTAAFLVTLIELEMNDGPDDVFPGKQRLCRKVQCLRLEETYILPEDAEDIYFALDEPMSVIKPDEESVEILGYAALPIRWTEQKKYDETPTA